MPEVRITHAWIIRTVGYCSILPISNQIEVFHDWKNKFDFILITILQVLLLWPYPILVSYV